MNSEFQWIIIIRITNLFHHLKVYLTPPMLIIPFFLQAIITKLKFNIKVIINLNLNLNIINKKIF